MEVEVSNYLIDMEKRPCYCEKNHIWVAKGEPNIQWFCSPTCAAERIETEEARRKYEELGTKTNSGNPAVPDVAHVVVGVTDADKL